MFISATLSYGHNRLLSLRVCASAADYWTSLDPKWAYGLLSVPSAMVTVFPQLLSANTVGVYVAATKLTQNVMVILAALQLIPAPLDVVWQPAAFSPCIHAAAGTDMCAPLLAVCSHAALQVGLAGALSTF